MSYQYPQYPQYSQVPGSQLPTGPGGSGIGDQPGTGAAAAPPTYTPLPSDLSPAEVQSLQLANIAAGKKPAELAVKGPDAPQDFPLAMYNAQTRTIKPAKDAKEKSDLESKGYSTTPFPPEDPYALTAQMLQDLQTVWSKAGDALKQLMLLVEQQQKQMQAAQNVLGAGQQAPPQQWTGQQYPTSGYPQTPTGD